MVKVRPRRRAAGKFSQPSKRCYLFGQLRGRSHPTQKPTVHPAVRYNTLRCEHCQRWCYAQYPIDLRTMEVPVRHVARVALMPLVHLRQKSREGPTDFQPIEMIKDFGAHTHKHTHTHTHTCICNCMFENPFPNALVVALVKLPAAQLALHSSLRSIQPCINRLSRTSACGWTATRRQTWKQDAGKLCWTLWKASPPPPM